MYNALAGQDVQKAISINDNSLIGTVTHRCLQWSIGTYYAHVFFSLIERDSLPFEFVKHVIYIYAYIIHG